MNLEVGSEIQNLRARCAVLLKNGEYAGGFKCLANILASVQASREELFFEDGGRCREFVLNQTRELGMPELKETIEQIVQRLERMVRAGIDSVYEEVMLVLTLRIQVDLLVSLAKEAFGSDVIQDSFAFDTDLEATLVSPSFQSVIQQAQSKLRRNWGVPLKTRWIVTSVKAPT